MVLATVLGGTPVYQPASIFAADRFLWVPVSSGRSPENAYNLPARYHVSEPLQELAAEVRDGLGSDTTSTATGRQ